MDLWGKVDEVKDELGGGIREGLQDVPLDKKQAAIILLLGIAFVEDSIGFFPVETLNFHIINIFAFLIGLGFIGLWLVWWGLFY